MGQVLIRNLDDAVIEQHRARAKARGVSLEQELRDVLSAAARPGKDELLAEMRRIRELTPQPPTGEPAIEGWELIREDRDTR